MVNFLTSVDMADHCTFGVHAVADFLVTISSEEELVELTQTPEWEKYPHILLGWGANILFTQDYHGIVVKNTIMGKNILQETEEFVDIEVGAGEDWNTFVHRTVDNNWWGIENLVAIPGTVGASPVQNIWAYGVEAKDTIISVQWINLATGKSETLSNEACDFGYRSSIFKDGLNWLFVVTKVVFRLQKVTVKYKFHTNYRDIEKALQGHKEILTVKRLADMIEKIRNEKLPDRHKLGTAGSFFKNPMVSKVQVAKIQSHGRTQLITFSLPEEWFVKLSAGQLIELAWYKWFRKWDAGVYEHHALVLVNHWDAHGKDIAELAQAIQAKVKTMFGITLEPEVIYV